VGAGAQVAPVIESGTFSVSILLHHSWAEVRFPSSTWKWHSNKI
jgi:hypothetical protein